MKIIDAHVHITNENGNHAPLYELAERLGYESLAIMSTSCINPDQNILCARCKLAHPDNTYVFGGLEYVTGTDFKTQAENLYAMGFDGVKMLEGKPTTRRLLGNAIDDPVYDEYYKFMEEKGFPILFHMADPATFWDKELVPDWAVANGWFYGENDVPYEQYYSEVESLLKKFPRLNAIFAHFFFLSGNMDKAQKFLDAHPSVFIDVTAGIEMYEDFSKNPAAWREFFIKNRDRIIFGTDSSDEPLADDGAVAINAYAAMEIEFLKSDGEIKINGKTLRGLGLPENVLTKIFSANFLKLVGDTPRKLFLPLSF